MLAAFPTLTKPTKLPARANLSESLRQTGVISYDPTHATLLRRTHAGPVYLIPAEVGRLPKPAACRKVRDADAYVDARRTEQGAGPGVVAYGRAAESASAGSLAAINGFEDGPQILNGGSSGSFVVPDSVAQVRYVLPGNRIRSEHVSHNLVAGPFTKSPPQLPKAGFTSPYAKRFTAWIEKYEPTAIRWIGANGKLIATHKRPRGEITTDIRVFRFLSTVLRSATVLSTG
ncbi:MAG: hypothetical protein J2O48_10320 [Solirubrobacterales bacterium]|nr:hypothetical protein [Solirubrobacterales bacterium]